MLEDDRSEEISLIDFLSVIWKFKYFILSGTLGIALITAVIGFSRPKIYRAEMVVKPGIANIGKSGEVQFIDDPMNMKILVENELRPQLEKRIQKLDFNKLSPSLDYKLIADNSKNTLTVFYDSTKRELATEALQNLLDALTQKYSRELMTFLRQYDSEIALTQKEISLSKKIQEYFQKNIDEINAELEKLRQKIHSSTDKNFSQNQPERYLHQYTDIVEILSRLQQTQAKKELKLVLLNEKITKLEADKKKLVAIKVIQSPIAAPIQRKGDLKLHLITATVIGFFFMTFLAFLIEFIRNVLKKVKKCC